MPYEVYADVMFFTNLTADFFVLAVCRLVLRRRTRFPRMCAAAAAGALYATAVFYLDFMPFWLLIPLGLLSLAATVIIAYGFGNIKKTVVAMLVFAGASFLLGGIVYAVYFFTPLAAVIYLSDGGFCLNLSFGTVFLLSALSAAVCFLVSALKSPLSELPFICDAEITVFGKTVSGKALCDTGNSLTDGIYGIPVIVCDHAFLVPALPNELKDPAVFADPCSPPPLPPEVLKKLRTVFARTVGGDKMLFAVAVDSIVLKGVKTSGRESAAAISVALPGKYPIILNPEIFR